MRIGLTGGIGCGKSTVLGLFAEQGWATVSCDALVAQLYREDKTLLEAVRERFGARVFEVSGALDRRKLGEVVFAEQGALEWLEEVLHPRVRALWETALEVEPERDWVVEIPLLFEKKLEKAFDCTLCVVADEATQLARLQQKGFTAAHARLRMVRQWPLGQKAQAADYVLVNDGSLDFLRDQVVYALELIRSRAHVA